MSHALVIALLTYLVGTASPGPSNMMIMGTAMRQGRFSAIILALGVICGSLFWEVMAASGISAILTTYAEAMTFLKIAGGLYLLYLAFKAGRSAMQASDSAPLAVTSQHVWGLFLRGVLMHLTNPKAVLTWIAVMSLGLQPDPAAGQLVAIMASCALLGTCVFIGYALLFSTSRMVAMYKRVRRGIEGCMAAMFAGAGIMLLWKRS